MRKELWRLSFGKQLLKKGRKEPSWHTLLSFGPVHGSNSASTLATWKVHVLLCFAAVLELLARKCQTSKRLSLSNVTGARDGEWMMDGWM
jgi:hypothetical protein